MACGWVCCLISLIRYKASFYVYEKPLEKKWFFKSQTFSTKVLLLIFLGRNFDQQKIVIKSWSKFRPRFFSSSDSLSLVISRTTNRSIQIPGRLTGWFREWRIKTNSKTRPPSGRFGDPSPIRWTRKLEKSSNFHTCKFEFNLSCLL